MTMTISSLNANGSRQKFKQDIIFTRLNKLGVDIVFLQDTHVANMPEAIKFSKLWEGRKFWSFDTRSCGVGILINKNLSLKLISEARDTEGTSLCLDVNMVYRKYRLINVYMHNDSVSRKQFINDLDGYLITPREMILSGDFNFVENINFYKMGGN